MRVKKSDKVIVIAGKDKGKTGVVVDILLEQDKVIVENVNIRTFHKKPTQQNPEGGIVKIESPIHVSNVMLIDGKGKSSVPSKVGYRYEVNSKTGKKQKVRFLKKTDINL